MEIYRAVVMHEFPWDMEQALGFALFRTFAVPGIGGLLAATEEFTGRTQKRYDDTALLLEPPTRLGFDHPDARAALRRINQMHRAYDIPDHQLRYVLSTFVVVPKRWLDRYGKRPLTPREVEASVHYYRELGRRMGIKDAPRTYADFEQLLDSYEAEHFRRDPGGRAVADATLSLMATFQPRPVRWMMPWVSRSLMDPPLLATLGYRAPPAPVARTVRGALRLRGRLLRAFPARRTPVRIEDRPHIRSYPGGFVIAQLGTSPERIPTSERPAPPTTAG